MWITLEQQTYSQPLEILYIYIRKKLSLCKKDTNEKASEKISEIFKQNTKTFKTDNCFRKRNYFLDC